MTAHALVVLALAMLAAIVANCGSVIPAIPQQGPELSSFVAAKREADYPAKAVKLESFLQEYPISVAKEEALEILLDTYEKLGNRKEFAATAGRLLQGNPENLLGLWARAKMFPYTDMDQSGQEQSLELAKRGLRVLGGASQPQGMSAAEFEKQRSAMSSAFNGVAGLVTLKMKDYSAAQRYLRASVDSNPDLFANVYPLALAYFLSEPAQPMQGLFFLARATNLAPESARKGLDAYGKEQCVKYYGSDRRWASIKATAKTYGTPPMGFGIDELR